MASAHTPKGLSIVRWAEQHSSNGEIRVRLENITFAAPVLIVHYIEEHGYLSPADFVKAVEEIAC